MEMPADNISAFETFIRYVNETESVISEDLAWRYINNSRYTDNVEYEKKYLDFVQNIQPHLAPYEDKVNRKMAENPLCSELQNRSEAYRIYLRSIKNAIKLYREENIPLFSEISVLTQQYGSITAAMTVEIDGVEMTLQQAGNILKSPDRQKRKLAYEKINLRRISDRETLNDLFDKLLKLRHGVALNCGFENFRDYSHQALGRFDYGISDCLEFHRAIAKAVVPLNRILDKERAENLKIDILKPYDMAVDPFNREALKPFTDGRDLLDRSI
jgi:oligoendopeptidase F